MRKQGKIFLLGRSQGCGYEAGSRLLGFDVYDGFYVSGTKQYYAEILAPPGFKLKVGEYVKVRLIAKGEPYDRRKSSNLITVKKYTDEYCDTYYRMCGVDLCDIGFEAVTGIKLKEGEEAQYRLVRVD